MTERLHPRPLSLLAFSAAIAVFAVYAGLRTNGLTTHYRNMFDIIGAPVSPLTRLVLDAPSFWWLIAAPAVAVFLWIACRPRVTLVERRRMRWSVVGVLVFGAAVYALVAYALIGPLHGLRHPV